MKPLSRGHFFPAGLHPGGLYLPNTAGPTILESREVLDTILRYVPRRGVFLEVGTWTGSLAAYLSDQRPATTIVSVDNFEFCPQNLALWQANRRQNMRLYIGDSDEFFRLIKLNVHCALVDGDHTEPGLTRDLDGAARVLAPTGFMLVHDYGCSYWTGVKPSVDAFCERTGWKIIERVRNLAVLAPPLPPRLVIPEPAKIRVGFFLYVLLFGGTEAHTVSLIQGMDRSRFAITGLAILNKGQIAKEMHDRVAPYCPVLDGPEHFMQLAERSDVVIASGIANLSLIDGYKGRVVFVCPGHPGQDGGTVNSAIDAMPNVTDYASVSENAAMSVPFPGRTPCTVVANGIDEDRCNSGRPREEVRKSLGIQPDEIIIGYVGRMSEEKRPLAAAQAAKALGGRFRAMMVGQGPGNDTERFVDAARAIAPGTIHVPCTTSIGEMYRAMDCVVIASAYEGFCLTLTEAWYSGVPTVMTPVGAVDELTELYGQLGIEIPVNFTADELASSVKMAISDDNKPVVANAQCVARSHFTANKMCERWERYLESMRT